MMMAPGMAGGQMGGVPGMPGQDVKKTYQTEREALEIVSHEYALTNAEHGLLQKWKKQQKAQ
eukprot:GDKH01022220.1.p2 GENE.GDKH01022220.1~~GDKH01022220.1.p2  ORF type:complete len:62 (-),score=12.09 GDKH01022220.1:86-271(-)